jgi:hypothetical protein
MILAPDVFIRMFEFSSMLWWMVVVSEELLLLVFEL